MTAWAFTINVPLLPDPTGSTSAYAVVNSSLLVGYASTINAPLLASLAGPASNYRLAFNSDATVPHKVIGQIWPRGAGEA